MTVYKLTIGNTVEERIIELQEKKRLLAENTIEGSQNKKFKLGLDIQELMSLFKSTDHDNGSSPRKDKSYSNEKDTSNDIGHIMQSMRGLTKRSRVERKESEIYGRRW